MKHNITQTENYLLIVDDSEIKVGDWIYNEEREPSVIQCIGKGSLRGWKKIIAHLPLNGAPVLEGVDLLPKIENEVEELANNMFEEHSTNVLSPQHEMRKMFMYGYNKAKEKYKYTDEDIIKIVEKSRETGLTAEYLMLSLQQPKMPIAFECEVKTEFGFMDLSGKTPYEKVGQTVWVGKYIFND
jgi:hypothetical protein